MQLERRLSASLIEAAQVYPVVTVVGARQTGKTTLVRRVFPDKPYVNLEHPETRDFARSDAKRFLEQYPEGCVIDEVQHLPELLSYIQVRVDDHPSMGMYVLTGSHQVELHEHIGQTLAGRTALLQLHPLSFEELEPLGLSQSLDAWMVGGFYPRMFQHPQRPEPFYKNYTQTYLERDLRRLVAIKDLDQFQKFMKLCAARLGCTLSLTALANACGVARATVQAWLSMLQAAYIITLLPPYDTNLGQRVIKSPKLYFTDVGLACYLLGVDEPDQLTCHNLRGALVENLVINELTKWHVNQGLRPQLYHYRNSNQLEVDVLLERRGVLVALEIKSGTTFRTDWLRSLARFAALKHPQPLQPALAYAGDREQRVGDVDVINLQRLHHYLGGL